MPKTDEQYIKTSGQQCPDCNSYEITSIDNVEIDNGSAWQQIHCNLCQATWQDVYTLTGYDNLKEG